MNTETTMNTESHNTHNEPEFLVTKMIPYHFDLRTQKQEYKAFCKDRKKRRFESIRRLRVYKR